MISPESAGIIATVYVDMKHCVMMAVCTNFQTDSVDIHYRENSMIAYGYIVPRDEIPKLL